ncbi:uncharacterized protein LOC141666142 [Apium graveolens]|uniref:uncharacterized protein LOC141666142 n=1 Tax=Apium graveolens TaxID=4045 RepID=UPI003D7A6EA2
MEIGKIKEGGVGLNNPMLARSNYTAWAIKMKVFMEAHAVWDAVEPKDPKTKVVEITDKFVLAAIYQAIPEDMVLSLAEKTTTKEAWDAIKTLCLGADRVKKATIASTIEQFSDLESMSVEEAVGSLKAHEERLKGQSEPSGGQLLLIEEEWLKKEKIEGQLLFTREEWLKRSNSRGKNSGNETRVREENRGFQDRSKVRCFNCLIYGHYAAVCRKPRCEKDQRLEVNMSQIPYDEPPLLMVECRRKNLLLNEEGVTPKLVSDAEKNEVNLTYGI